MTKQVTSYTSAPLGVRGLVLTLECGHTKHVYHLPPQAPGPMMAFCCECDRIRRKAIGQAKGAR